MMVFDSLLYRVRSPPAAPVYSRSTDETALRTPLQAAAENGFVAAIPLLLTRGAPADPHAACLAAAQGHAAVLQQLVPRLPSPLGAAEAGAAAGAASDATGEAGGEGGANSSCEWLREALSRAAGRGHEDAVRTLCSACASAISATGGDALLAACALRGRGDAPASGEGSGLRERLVACLLEAGAPPDVTNDAGNTPLHLAASRGLSTVAALLLGAGAPASRANLDEQRPADSARVAGHEEMAAMLAQRAPPASSSGRTALPPIANGAPPPSLGLTGAPPVPSPIKGAVLPPLNGVAAG